MTFELDEILTTREAAEVADVSISISVLTPLRPVPGPNDFEPGKHGIVMIIGKDRSVFLPEVARDHGWDRETTLTQLCQKAELPDDAWREPGVRFSVFETISFAEE